MSVVFPKKGQGQMRSKHSLCRNCLSCMDHPTIEQAEKMSLFKQNVVGSKDVRLKYVQLTQDRVNAWIFKMVMRVIIGFSSAKQVKLNDHR